MTAILRNVQKTFTFEEQRVEINEIAEDLYNLNLQEQDDVELIDFTVDTAITPNGGGSLTYVVQGTVPNQVGKFTFTPADVFSGDYDDLSNKPTKLSDFQNDLNLSIPSDLNDLDDVLIANETSNHYLKWNGTKWVNEVLNEIIVNKNTASATPDLTRTITTTGVTLTYTPPDLSGFAVKVTTDDASPFNPYDGQLWWKSDEGKLKIAYQDADSLQWVDASPAGIQVSDLSVTEKTPAAQSKLEYDINTGIFEYTPTTTSSSSGIALTDISVVKPNPAASQSGDVTYDNTSGEFTYTPPVIPTKIEDLDVTLTNLTDGHVLKWQTDKWVNAVDNVGTGGTGIALTDLEVVKPNPAASNTPDLTYNNLTGKFTYTPPIIPAAQIQTDWDQVDNTALDYFKNRPTIPAAQVQSDWNATAPSGGLGVILNKPYVPPFAEIADPANNIDSGKVLKWNGTEWSPGTDVSGGASTTARGVYVPEVDKTATSTTAVYTNNDKTITFPANGSANYWKDIKFKELEHDKVYEFKYTGQSTGTGAYWGWFISDNNAVGVDGSSTIDSNGQISENIRTTYGTSDRWICYNADHDNSGDNGSVAGDTNTTGSFYTGSGAVNWANPQSDTDVITTWHIVIDMPRRKVWVKQYYPDNASYKYGSGLGPYKWKGYASEMGFKCDPTDPTSSCTFALNDPYAYSGGSYGTNKYYFNFGCFVEMGGTGTVTVEEIPEKYSAFRNIGGGSSSLDLTSLSVTKATASGGGDLTYDNAGTFTYTPPELGDYITLDDVPSPVVTSDTPPTTPSDGDLWWHSTQGTLKVYYEDANTSQWVDTSGGGSGGSTSPGGADTQLQFNSTGSFAGDASLTWDNTNNKLKIGTDATDSYLEVGSSTKRFQIRNNDNSSYLYSYAPNTFHIALASPSPAAGASIQLDWISGTMAHFKRQAECSLYYNNVQRIKTTDDGAKIIGGIQDKDGELGTAGQILSSTGTELDWIDAPSSGANVSISDNPPASPTHGDLWWESDEGDLKIYYNDGNTSQWVSTNQVSGTFNQSGGASVTVSETAPSSPSQGDLWWKSDEGQLKIAYQDVDSLQWVDTAGGGGGPTTFTGAAEGLVPDGTTAGNTKFLKSDGSWDTPTLTETAQDLDSVLTEGNTAAGKSLTVDTLNDVGGNVRSLPVNTQAAGYTIQTSDTGKMVRASGTITVSSANQLAQGDIVTIYNASSSDISIERSGVDMYLVGDSTSQNRTLAQKGIATLVCVGSQEYVLMGGGIT